MMSISAGPTLMVRYEFGAGAYCGLHAALESRRVPAGARALRAQLEQCGTQLASEPVERGLRRRNLAAYPRHQHGQPPGAERGHHEYECPLHAMSLAVQGATDLGRELLVPVAAFEEEMEVEEIIGGKGRADASFGELGRESPHLHANAARHEQVDDPPAGFLGDRGAALRALKTVGAALVVGADPDGQVVRGQLHVATAWAVRPDRRQRFVPVLGGSGNHAPAPDLLFGTPQDPLEGSNPSGP
jgi:hypothetical protein